MPVKEQCRFDVRKYSFSQRTINVWNKLSTDCGYARSVDMFKNRIDKYIVKTGYTQNSMNRLSISSSFLVYCHLRHSMDGNLVKS